MRYELFNMFEFITEYYVLNEMNEYFAKKKSFAFYGIKKFLSLIL